MATAVCGACKRKLAASLSKLTSAKIFNHGAPNGAELSAPQLLAGFPWGAAAMRTAGPNELACQHVCARQLNWQRARRKPREVWRAPSCLSAQDPHPWSDLIASSGLSSPAAELERNKAIKAQGEMLSFLPSELGEIQLNQLRLILDDPVLTPLVGGARRARRAIAD